MSESPDMPRGPIFPAWFDKVVKLAFAVIGGGVVYSVLVYSFAASPRTLAVGYEPDQPVAYSHAVHAGQLGIDCRYCHNTVERTEMAAVPPTDTCMNCHSMLLTESEKLIPVRESRQSGEPIPWVRVHDLPDFVYFNHSAHVSRGVGCVTCHGRVDRMEKIRQVEPLSMGWCLDCHRDPAPNLRPVEEVTSMDWLPDGDPRAIGEKLMAERNIRPSTDCSTCHR